MPQGQSRLSSSKRPDTYPAPAWQVAAGTNLQMSFPLNCGQRFSMPQRSFRTQQRLGGPLASWMRKRLRSIGGRPLMMDENETKICIVNIIVVLSVPLSLHQSYLQYIGSSV